MALLAVLLTWSFRKRGHLKGIEPVPTAQPSHLADICLDIDSSSSLCVGSSGVIRPACDRMYLDLNAHVYFLALMPHDEG
ncbi:hypothetical protein QBC45DRAFT_407868, partial [Copromyces sp. CBS 386.78]